MWIVQMHKVKEENAERKLKGNILKEANAYCSNAVDIVRKYK